MAYRLLHYHGISPENLAIVGEGYSKPEWVGLMEPRHLTHRRIRVCAFMGALFASALAFAVMGLYHSYGSQISLTFMAVIPIASGLGALLGVGLASLWRYLSELGRLSVYRHHLRQGHYLLMIEGQEKIVRLSQEVLGQYAPPRHT